MTVFFDLYAANGPEGGPGADSLFRTAVENSPFQLWAPGDPIPRHDVRLLIGVATTSGYDMRLLDVIGKALARWPSALPTVDLFDAIQCTRPEDYEAFIPALREVHHTPAAGIWFGGQLTWFGQGRTARDQIARMFGSTSDDIVEYVQQWNLNRTRGPRAEA